ncbi:hypothetical protein [Paenibacillus sp. FSL K6-2862]|uniref:hypothetical protein n=1 Tax=Paenibacillus sp. FSL K6-2862 TaxID=2921484 RepID=UPI0030F5A276
MAMSEVQQENILTYVNSLPSDIGDNIIQCMNRWSKGEQAYGYIHPVQVCSNLLALQTRMPFLSDQQAMDLMILKIYLQQTT